MTFGKLLNIVENLPNYKDIKLMSDSGWECDATEMDAAYYNSKENVIVFTQKLNVGYTDCDENQDWILLYKEV